MGRDHRGRDRTRRNSPRFNHLLGAPMSTGTKQAPQSKTVEIDRSVLEDVLKATQEKRERWSVSDLKVVAKEAADSKMFGMTESQAFMLMQIAEAEGIHPVKALQRYHISHRGTAILKAESALADFQKRGGTVEWITESNDRGRAEAVFRHPRLCPEGKTVVFSIQDAELAGLTQKRNSDGSPNNWVKFPSAMMRARVSTIGVRMIDPAILAGMCTEEEDADIT